MKINWPLLAAGAGALVVGAIWAFRLATPGSGQGAILRPDDAALVARGQRIYQRECASCHGADLQGQPGWRTGPGKAPPHDASGHTWHHPDAMLVMVTAEGTQRRGGAMPAFAEKLSREDIIAVLSWIKSRWPKEIRAAHDRMNRRMNGRGAGRG